MQPYLLLAWLAVTIACSATKPATPPSGGAADPALVALLAAVDDALAARPRDGVLLYQRASLMIPVGAKPTDALPFLERLDAIGWDIPLAPIDFVPLERDPHYRELAARIAARAPQVRRSTVAFSVSGNDLIPEGIAVDPTTGTFYLGSLRKRTIVAIDAAGASRPFIPEGQAGILGVTGVKVDPARGVLWAGSYASRSMVGYRPADREAGGVYAFALSDGSVRRRVRFPDRAPHLANDLAIASDGVAYVTDSLSGSLYRIPTDRDELELVVPVGTFAYPNGLALANDATLYVADAIGIVRIALDTRAVKRLTAPPEVALGGIDGMVFDGDRLFGVQNLGLPRIVAITLEGDQATGLAVLENAADALELPTTTSLWQGALYTIANSQLGAFGPSGLRPGRTLADPRILRTPL